MDSSLKPLTTSSEPLRRVEDGRSRRRREAMKNEEKRLDPKPQKTGVTQLHPLASLAR
jgi:hypothetical protein